MEKHKNLTMVFDILSHLRDLENFWSRDPMKFIKIISMVILKHGEEIDIGKKSIIVLANLPKRKCEFILHYDSLRSLFENVKICYHNTSCRELDPGSWQMKALIPAMELG